MAYKPDTSTSYYEVLGITRAATTAEVSKAYKRKALECHPDRVKGDKDIASAAFQRVAEAYETLNDDQKRRVYDLTLHRPTGAERPSRTSRTPSPSVPPPVPPDPPTSPPQSPPPPAPEHPVHHGAPPPPRTTAETPAKLPVAPLPRSTHKTHGRTPGPWGPRYPMRGNHSAPTSPLSAKNPQVHAFRGSRAPTPEVPSRPPVSARGRSGTGGGPGHFAGGVGVGVGSGVTKEGVAAPPKRPTRPDARSNSQSSRTSDPPPTSTPPLSQASQRIHLQALQKTLKQRMLSSKESADIARWKLVEREQQVENALRALEIAQGLMEESQREVKDTEGKWREAERELRDVEAGWKGCQER